MFRTRDPETGERLRRPAAPIASDNSDVDRSKEKHRVVTIYAANLIKTSDGKLMPGGVILPETWEWRFGPYQTFPVAFEGAEHAVRVVARLLDDADRQEINEKPRDPRVLLGTPGGDLIDMRRVNGVEAIRLLKEAAGIH